jgi:hypothetical protein
VIHAEVALISHHDQAGGGQGLGRCPRSGPRSGHGPRRQRAGHPHDVPVGTGDDLQVHPVLAVLAGIERPVGRHPLDGDQGPVDDQVGVPGLGRVAQRLAQLGGRAASSATVSVTYLQAVAVPTPNPAASSANVSPFRRQASTSSADSARLIAESVIRPVARRPAISGMGLFVPAESKSVAPPAGDTSCALACSTTGPGTVVSLGSSGWDSSRATSPLPAAAMARLSQRLVECIAGVGGHPRHAGVGDQCGAGRLVGLVAEVAANVALMGDEQGAAQRVPALALVELAA